MNDYNLCAFPQRRRQAYARPSLRDFFDGEAIRPVSADACHNLLTRQVLLAAMEPRSTCQASHRPAHFTFRRARPINWRASAASFLCLPRLLAINAWRARCRLNRLFSHERCQGLYFADMKAV